MARKFLYAIVIVIGIILVSLLTLRIFSDPLTKMALVPDVPFEDQAAVSPEVYAENSMWLSRPGMKNNPALQMPDGANPTNTPVNAAVFFVHPTSYYGRLHWNGPLDDASSRDLAEKYIGLMASPFADSAALWAPRYRQATFGAFLATSPDGQRALDIAFGDIRAAFANFLTRIPDDQPIVLAGHSQGALLLMHLLQQDIAGKPLAKRIAAAYIIGWPVSVAHDLPAMGLDLCTAAAQANCVMTWQSYAEPADPYEFSHEQLAWTALDGSPRFQGTIACTNPLTGGTLPVATAELNLGALAPPKQAGEPRRLVVGGVPARCDKNGLLLIGSPPDMGEFVLPGNNYHVYDIPLFWANLRADFARRVATWHSNP